MKKSHYQDVPVFLKPEKKQRRKPEPAMVKEVKIAKQMRRNGCKYKYIAFAFNRPITTVYQWVNKCG
jgi:transposase